MLNDLRRKFVCIMMTIVTVMMCVIFGMVIGFTRRSLEQESIEHLRQIASGPGQGPGLREEQLPRASWFAMSQKPDGTVQVSGDISLDDYDQEQLLTLWNEVSKEERQTGVLQDWDLRYYRADTPMGLRVAFLDIAGQRGAMDSLVRVSVFVGVISMAAMFGLSILLARWAVKPVELAWQQQRQFVADASHELKTPLTVIMTNAELMQSGEERDQSRAADSILTMSRQMWGLVEGLLELARVDNGAVKVHFAPLQLSELISDGLLPFEPLFYERGLPLLAQVEPGLHCKGSVPHLRQALEILLDNAMKYTTPGGTVRVTLKRQGAQGILSVAGPGAVISQADLKNIFKRFYRIDKARSRDGSYGLGLAIAQSIVEEHNGKIWAESVGGINTFYVQLPLN